VHFHIKIHTHTHTHTHTHSKNTIFRGRYWNYKCVTIDTEW